MTKMIMFHEVENADSWANAWKEGAGSRHELFGKIGVKVQTFRDPNNPNLTGGILEIPDMKAFEEFLASEELQKATAADGLKIETLRMLTEFTP